MGKDARSALLPGTLELLILRTHKLTPMGRRLMAVECEEFDRVILAIHKVLNAT